MQARHRPIGAPRWPPPSLRPPTRSAIAAFHPQPEADPDGTSGQRRGDGGYGAPRTRRTSRRSTPLRATALVLTAVGALLIFPLDALAGGTALKTLGVILAVVGIAGALASGPVRASGGADPPTGR